jgi:hypothetical protein
MQNAQDTTNRSRRIFFPYDGRAALETGQRGRRLEVPFTASQRFSNDYWDGAELLVC